MEEALKMTVYILNRVPTKAFSKPSFELSKCWKSSLRHIRVWGCSSEVRIYNPQEKRLETLLGISLVMLKNQIVIDSSYCTRMVESKNTKFLENTLIRRGDQITGLSF